MKNFEEISKVSKNIKEKTLSNFNKDNIKAVKNKAKDGISTVSNKITDKVKKTITEEEMQGVLNTLYIKSINGIPKVSLPIEDLVNDYMSKNDSVEKAAKSLITTSTVKCGTSGFLSSFGGLATMIVTLPANLTSVMYVQLRMCCAIAAMAGYDIHSDQVQTLIYVCLTGSAASEILKSAGVKFGNKFGTALVKKIPGKVIKSINQKVGHRFVTKFGQKGIVNLGNVVPVIGGVIGGGMDVASTQIIGKNVYNIFIKGEMPSNDKNKDDDIIVDVDYEDIDDVDTNFIKKS